MYVFISRKFSFIILICAIILAFSLIFLLDYAFSGPKLGRIYDLLLDSRTFPPVSRDILLINTEENISSAEVFSIILTLGEMGASQLIIEVPIFGMGTGKIEDNEDLRRNITDEFLAVNKNIRALFDAIRFGFISPLESPGLIDSMMELTDKGRDRINEAIIRQEGASVAFFAQSTDAFVKIFLAADEKPMLDKDGVFRRIAPVSSVREHICYKALKSRWSETRFESTEDDLILINSFLQHGVLTEYRFNLDKEGNILFEKPQDSSFRRLPIDYFKKYEQADRQMAALLKDAQKLGIYKNIEPEEMPSVLYDFSDSRKEELILNPNDENFSAWIISRLQYIKSIENFLDGSSEMLQVNTFEELIAEDDLDEEEIENLENQRNELISTFAAIRNKYAELLDTRNFISKTVYSSFCILKPEKNISAAILANSLLTGRSITPGKSLYSIIWSCIVVLIFLALIHTMHPLKQLFFGCALSLLAGIGFSINFIINGYWINPLIPLLACVFGTLIMFFSRYIIGLKKELKFNFAYSPAINKAMFKSLAKTGRPLINDKISEYSTIIAVKNSCLSDIEDNEKPQFISGELENFMNAVYEKFKKAGATILGFNGDTALACFGSPLEQNNKNTKNNNSKKNNSKKAVQIVMELLSLKDDKNCFGWVFGIESGECDFSWSPHKGYTADGRAVFRAKIFSSLTKRYNTKAIIGENVKNDAELQVKALASIKGTNFYELII